MSIYAHVLFPGGEQYIPVLTSFMGQAGHCCLESSQRKMSVNTPRSSPCPPPPSSELTACVPASQEFKTYFYFSSAKPRQSVSMHREGKNDWKAADWLPRVNCFLIGQSLTKHTNVRDEVQFSSSKKQNMGHQTCLAFGDEVEEGGPAPILCRERTNLWLSETENNIMIPHRVEVCRDHKVTHKGSFY